MKNMPLNNDIRRQMTQAHIPGLSMAILCNGKVVQAKGYGNANRDLRIPATADTVYQIGSITKPFTAMGVLILVEEDKIKLSDRITQSLPSLPDAWKEVTLRHLLTHTSGIQDYTDVPDFEKLMLTPATHDVVLQTVSGDPLEFTPGDRWSYSNTNYYLLGMLLEKASGQPYGKFLQWRIFQPLGMTATQVGMTATQVSDQHQVAPNRASGYQWHAGGLSTSDPVSMDWPFAAGAILSTVTDLAKWDAALDTDYLLKASTRQQMWTGVRLNSGHTADYGFGWFLGLRNGHPLHSHPGNISGFSSHILRFPDDRLTIILLCNQELDLAPTSHSLAARLIPTLARRLRS